MHCIVAVVLLSAFMQGNAVTVKFKDCGSKMIKVESLDFDCEGGVPLPCAFKRGSTYRGKVNLNPTAEVTNGTIALHALIAGALVPFPLKNPNICSDHNIKCPMKPGEEQVFEIQLEVPSFAPDIKFMAKIEIITSTKVDAACFEFIGEIKSSNKLIN